ncbi:MAG: rRNA maturation RNase YbeY [Thiohalomonadaceae bacterium]
MVVELDLQIISIATDIPSARKFQSWVEASLSGQGDPVELTVRVVDEAESAALNSTYRHKQGPTNVLSFPFQSPPGVELPLLGDIVICAPVVVREAAEQDKALLAHWAHMTVHGCLHLLGYDHIYAVEAEQMEMLEKRSSLA